jgi:hypothetical protein
MCAIGVIGIVMPGIVAVCIGVCACSAIACLA